MKHSILVQLLLIAFSFAPALGINHGEVRTVVIDSSAIRGNPLGLDPKRSVTVYLPPSYTTSDRSYPVIYLLHGSGDNHMNFVDDDDPLKTIQGLMEAGIEKGRFGEFIIVTPDESTPFGGSFYVDSATTGNWETFTAKELVEHIDRNFRTLPNSGGRAIAGHSMGGYGALAIAMKHPDVFSVVYSLNGGLLSFDAELAPTNPDVRRFVQAKSVDELLKTKSRYAIGMLMVAQAFSPNPKISGLLAEKPYIQKGSKMVPNYPAYDRWQERDIIRMAATYADNLRQLKGIKFDCATNEDITLLRLNARRLDKTLEKMGIPHEFEEYNGDHRNRLWGLGGRIFNELLPFVDAHVVRGSEVR